MKEFILSLLIVGIFLRPIGVIAGDRAGNGGSGNESEIAVQQALFESVALKIKNFFSTNEAKIAPLFEEINIKDLIDKIKSAQVRVSEESLIDKNGVTRTCLNFPEKSLIHCNSSLLKELNSKPEALFVLVFHEYLGLINAEETSPNDPTVVNGYSISKKLAPFVTKVNEYDLRIIPQGCRITSDSEDVNSFLIKENYTKSHPYSAQVGIEVVYSWRRPVQLLIYTIEEFEFIKFSSIDIKSNGFKNLQEALLNAKKDIDLACSKSVPPQSITITAPHINGIPFYANVMHLPLELNITERMKNLAKICKYFGFTTYGKNFWDHHTKAASISGNQSMKMIKIEGNQAVIKNIKSEDVIGRLYPPYYFSLLTCINE